MKKKNNYCCQGDINNYIKDFGEMHHNSYPLQIEVIPCDRRSHPSLSCRLRLSEEGFGWRSLPSTLERCLSVAIASVGKCLGNWIPDLIDSSLLMIKVMQWGDL